MLEYFGEKDAGDCGMCDVCRSRRGAAGGSGKGVERSLEESIMYLLSHGWQTPDYLASQTGRSVADVIRSVRSLAAEGMVRIDGLRVGLQSEESQS